MKISYLVYSFLMVCCFNHSAHSQVESVEAIYLTYKPSDHIDSSNLEQEFYKIRAIIQLADSVGIDSIHINFEKDNIIITDNVISFDPLDSAVNYNYRRKGRVVYLYFGPYSGQSSYELEIKLEDENANISTPVSKIIQ